MASSIQIYITWIKVFIELEIPIELKWNKHKINQLLFCIEIAIRNRSVWYVSHSFEEVDFNEYSNMNSPPFYWKMTIDAVLINLKYAKESRQFGNSNLRFPELFLKNSYYWCVDCGVQTETHKHLRRKNTKYGPFFFQNRDDIFHFDV